METYRDLHVFADGSFDPKSGDGGWAFVAYRNNVEIASGAGRHPHSANNAMEVLAVLQAAAWINSHALAERAVIWSDSIYAVKGCNSWRRIWRGNGWKKIVPNSRKRSRTIPDAEIWKAVDSELMHNPLISVAWCKGHAGVGGNEKADELAGRQRGPRRTIADVNEGD